MSAPTITQADWERTPWHARRRLLTDLERNLRDVRAQLAEANADLTSAQHEAAAYRQAASASEALAAARSELRAVVVETKRIRSSLSPMDEARALLALITLDPPGVIAERQRAIHPLGERAGCRGHADLWSRLCPKHTSGRRSDAGKTKPHGRTAA